MSMTTQSISPLWETMPLQKTAPAAEKPAAGSLFADIFKSAIENVREAEDDVAKKEYLLSHLQGGDRHIPPDPAAGAGPERLQRAEPHQPVRAVRHAIR